MLAAILPLFDENVAVQAYSVFSQRDNSFLGSMYGGENAFGDNSSVEGFEVIQNMGMDTLADGHNIFVPITSVSLFMDIEGQAPDDRENIVLLLDTTIPADDRFVERVSQLKMLGFQVALRDISIHQIGDYKALLDLADYLFLDHHKVNIEKAKGPFMRFFPDMKLVAVNVDSQWEFRKLLDMGKFLGGFDLYEGDFFRRPASAGDKELAPLKITYLDLLKVVNKPDFDLTDAADIIGKDTALVISLLEMVNKMTVNSNIASVRHAAAMLGQKELKRWINTAVTKELCSDKPSEIMRSSLIRGRFAENLAKPFKMQALSTELFLMGMFSLLDVILDKPMEEALQGVSVTPEIEDAIMKRQGELAPVLTLIVEYETASWQEVSRQLVLQNLDMDAVYEAYLEALRWYRDLLGEATGAASQG